LEKEFIDFGSGVFFDFSIADEHTSKGRYRIAGKGYLPGPEERFVARNSTSIGVFQDSESWFAEFIDQRYGGVDVDQVIVRKFFTVDFFKHGIKIAIKNGCLMRVFAVAKRFVLNFAVFEYGHRAAILIEIIEDSSIVMRGSVKCFAGKVFALFEGCVAFIFAEKCFKFAVVVF